MPTLALHGINSDSAGGIKPSLARNPPEEWLFRQESQPLGRGIHWRNEILLEVTSTKTKNPTKEWDSTRNNQLVEAHSDQQGQNV
jgi:hypothetical protein